MGAFPRLVRLAAAAIASTCWAGLAARLGAIIDGGASPPRALWIMLRTFTELTDLGVALLFTALALGRWRFAAQSLLGGAAVSSALVTAVSYWLLGGSLELNGGATTADVLLHFVGPIAVMVFWLELAPKDGLTLSDPFLWLIYPLAYFDYALLRGAAESHFAYHFLNGIELGWDRTFWTTLLILASYLDAGLALVWVDGMLGKPRSAPRVAF